MQDTSFYIKARNFELNLELQFSRTFAKSNFETASCYSFLRVERLKLHVATVVASVTEN